jgi:hypothetical protein
MTTRSRTPHWISRAVFGGTFAVSVLIFALTACCQTPSPAPGAPVAKGATSVPESVRDDHDTAQARDGLEILEALLEAKRTLLHIDESRAEQAKRWKAVYEKQVRDGRVTEDRLIAAKDDVLMLDAQVMADRAELKVAEMRVKNARRHVARSDQAAGGADQAREEAEVLEALLEAKRTVLRAGESRADQAKRVEAHYERLFRNGMVTEDQLLAAKDDVLLMESILALGRADLNVAEIRVKNARQLASQGGAAADSAARRLLDLEERLAEAEMKADVLQHEVGRLRRELPRETRGTR